MDYAQGSVDRASSLLGGVANKLNMFRMADADDEHKENNNLNVTHTWRQDHANLAHHKLDEEEKALMASYESLDYEVVRNDVYIARQGEAAANEKAWAWAANWTTFGVIGATTGLVAFFMGAVIDNIYIWKWSMTRPYVQDNDLVGGYFTFCGISLFLGLVSTSMVCFGEPVSAGSGIPEVKSYLNGTNYLRFLKAKTGMIKAIGVCLSVTSGLIIGKEGPLIHIGSTCGANYATLPKLSQTPCGRGKKWPYRFRTDRHKRDFVSGGAAAGVAAAFGAPTGGICFSLEEAASFWSLSLTWRTYLATMLSTSTLWILLAWSRGLESYDQLGPTFGKWDDQKKFELWELPFFGVIAVFGGFMGALFCELNLYLSQWRRKYTQGRTYRRMADALMCVFITATVNFWMPTWVGGCEKIVENFQCNDRQNKYSQCYGLYNSSITESYDSFLESTCSPPNPNPCCYDYKCPSGGDYSRYNCPEGYFSQAGTMSFAFTEDAIKGFFHNEAAYSLEVLIVYFICTFFVANITYGIAVPSGLFVPCILMGSSFGRFWGECLKVWFSASVRPGVYALIGAAAMLSSVTRITITITVILFETTNQVFLIMPIMATVLIAKWIADVYNISLYDMHVELKCVPFVEPDPPVAMEGMLTGEVMTQNVLTLNEVASVSSILNVLENSTHNGFPVVSNDKQKYRGTIIRNQLIVLLRRTMWTGTVADILSERATPKPLLELEDFASSLESKNLPFDDLSAALQSLGADVAIDLRPYMNPAAIFVIPECPITRCFTLFRGMGIRHLPVVDDEHQVIGIISRKELMTDFAQDLY